MPRKKTWIPLLLAACLLLLSLNLSATTCGAWGWVNPVPQGNTLNSITYANGLWVAVGDWGTIITSPDGANWTIRNSGVSNNLKGAVWGGGKWVVVGSQDTILISTDGVWWTLRHSGDAYNNFEGITWGGGGHL